MFEQLSERLDGIFARLKGHGKLTPDNVRDSLRDVRRALLEADVNFKVAKELIARVETVAAGQEVLKSLTPGAQVVKVVHDTLIGILGSSTAGLPDAKFPPRRILMVGLQGSGKTTTTAKLSAWLRRQKRIPAMAACDLQRPAAIDQLEILGKELDLRVYVDRNSKDPVKVARDAVTWARQEGVDDLLIDTAGRLQVDEELMEQLVSVRDAVSPDSILLVVDGMTGQEAVSVAQSFHQKLTLQGTILTKMDGDARGGAALSIRHVTGVPILYMGVGEKTSALEVFHPDRMASRILGMGDVLTLVERAQSVVDQDQALKLQEKLKHQAFTLEDFMDQIRQVRKMGPLEDIMKMIPGMGGKALKGVQIDPKELGRVEAMIRSMTPAERRRPEIINGSRRKRIAKGSGTTVQMLNRLLKDFDQMRKMMGQMAKGKGFGGFNMMRARRR
ncbi:MAG: signal recognition particle protein [Candidatus Eisenbacteria bacterium]|uniref:Signal recognition particle protein n=1 Tax=Eiseniibacteriota bacterium TaxID=2212470 RepID=A0A948W768_UNCEI|nr:signal recognition particle protein [Candidatus Eisenbacteria bacterium]MBU2691331.1 signal recognition particle protein [Candidatus Eisenbacteria bacterium]